MDLATVYQAQIAARRRAFVKQWNMGECSTVSQFYALSAAKLFDADGKTIIVGEENIIDYLNVTFEYANDHGRPPIELHSRRMFDDGHYIFDIGDHSWQNIHNGSYIHKWGWIDGEWLLLEDYFTIEQSFCLFADDDNKEN